MKIRDLPPESEWYRPPQFSRMGPRGDCECFMWVAEPIANKGVFGVAFRVSRSLAWSVCYIDTLYEKLRKEALKELYRRIERDEFHPEGCTWEVFEWNPIFVRDKDGNVTIQTTDVVDALIEPIMTPVVVPGLDTKNLYSRPGRFIPVDGNPQQLFKKDEPFETEHRLLDGGSDGKTSPTDK